MGIKRVLQALEKHAKEEWRIHAELIEKSDTPLKKLVKKHWRDVKKIHKLFFSQLKDAIKKPKP